MYRKSVEIWIFGFLIYASGQTDKQTDRQTYRHVDHFASLYTGGVVMIIYEKTGRRKQR